MAIIRINPDNSVERLECGAELRDLQHALDGAHIEDAGCFVFCYGDRAHESYRLIVDEEGKLKDLPVNPLATMATELYPRDIPEESINDLMNYLNDLKEGLS